MNTLFITGGSTSIGAASVLKFISEGNTCHHADIRCAMEATAARSGRLNSVVANAGIHRKVESPLQALWRYMMRIE